MITKEELGALILESEDALFRTGMSILRNEEDVGDAIQNAIVKAFEKSETLQKKQYARTWLMKILINECRDLWRKKNREYPVEEAEFFEEALPEADTRDYTELYRAILKLPQSMRTVLSLYYAEGFSIREIALLLDLSEGTIKSRLSRARTQLRAELQG